MMCAPGILRFARSEVDFVRIALRLILAVVLKIY